MSGNKRKLIGQEIQALLKKGVLEKCSDSEGQFISNVFIKLKPSGKYRMILDLSVLKGDLTYQHFKMENLQTAIDLMSPGCFMASLDLADAYYSIPVAEEDRKFLRLRWEGQLYQYTCLPNGLAQAPRNFTKILKPIFGHLALQGHISFGYIDDTFIMGQDSPDCARAVEALRRLFLELGFKIQGEKSVFSPTRQITFLGYSLNSSLMKVFPTEDKINGLELAREIRAIDSLSIRQLAGAIGVLNDLTKGCEYGTAHYRQLEGEDQGSGQE